MCGACGRQVQQDQWSPLLASRRARWEAAQVVNRLLGASRHPARVSCTAGSWVVRSGTGRSVVADTATQLWQAVLAVADLDPRLVGSTRSEAYTEVAAALASACELVRRSVAC